MNKNETSRRHFLRATGGTLGAAWIGTHWPAFAAAAEHRTHDIPNLFVCDGSSFVTSGRGQPTMTIQALAFRAGEHIARSARQGEI